MTFSTEHIYLWDICRNCFSIDEVMEEISDLSDSSEPGSMQFPTKIFKQNIVKIATFLCEIFNLVLQPGNIPSE